MFLFNFDKDNNTQLCYIHIWSWVCIQNCFLHTYTTSLYSIAPIGNLITYVGWYFNMWNEIFGCTCTSSNILKSTCIIRLPIVAMPFNDVDVVCSTPKKKIFFFGAATKFLSTTPYNQYTNQNSAHLLHLKLESHFFNSIQYN